MSEEATEAIINYEMPNFTNPESPYAIAGDLEVSAIEYENYLAGRRPRSVRSRRARPPPVYRGRP